MKITGKNSISNYIKMILQITFAFGTLVVLLLPWVVKIYIQFLRLDLQNFYFPCLILLYLSGIPMLIIVWQFIKLFDSLKKSQPFIMENARHLKMASWCCAIISVEYVVGIYVFHSIFTLIITGIFLIAWIGLSILSELFKQAVEFKEENDLTI